MPAALTSAARGATGRQGDLAWGRWPRRRPAGHGRPARPLGPPEPQIDDAGAEALVPAPGKIVHARAARLAGGEQRRGVGVDEGYCPTGGEPESGRRASTGRAAERQPDLSQGVAQAVGASPVALHQVWQLLGEGALRASGDTADEAAHP